MGSDDPHPYHAFDVTITTHSFRRANDQNRNANGADCVRTYHITVSQWRLSS